MSPETARTGDGGFSSDIWSLGCTVLQMVSGQPPWKEKGFTSVTQLLYYIGHGKEHPRIPAGVSKELQSFLLCCFQQEATDRPTAERLLEHPFITKEALSTWVSTISADPSRGASSVACRGRGAEARPPAEHAAEVYSSCMHKDPHTTSIRSTSNPSRVAVDGVSRMSRTLDSPHSHRHHSPGFKANSKTLGAHPTTASLRVKSAIIPPPPSHPPSRLSPRRLARLSLPRQTGSKESSASPLPDATPASAAEYVAATAPLQLRSPHGSVRTSPRRATESPKAAAHEPSSAPERHSSFSPRARDAVAPAECDRRHGDPHSATSAAAAGRHGRSGSHNRSVVPALPATSGVCDESSAASGRVRRVSQPLPTLPTTGAAAEAGLAAPPRVVREFSISGHSARSASDRQPKPVKSSLPSPRRLVEVREQLRVLSRLPQSAAERARRASAGTPPSTAVVAAASAAPSPSAPR